jgi:hypothetical protein
MELVTPFVIAQEQPFYFVLAVGDSPLKHQIDILHLCLLFKVASEW